jgi:hypothetical protein
MVLPAIAQLRGEEPGSLLIFPEFNIAPPAVTQLRITDTQDPALGGTTRIMLQYICPGVAGVCATVSRHKFVTFHGTLVVDVSTDLGGPFPGAPCNNGYVIAIVEDASHRPIASNFLIGSYRISGVADEAEATNAIAVQSARTRGAQLGTISATGELVLNFGSNPARKGKTPGSDYVPLPDELTSDFQAVQTAAVPPKRTQLIVLTPTIQAGLPNPTANLAVHAWNQFEDEFSTTEQFTCWAKLELDSIAGFFNAAALGTPIGSVRVESLPSGTYFPALLGVIRETGPGPTVRRMYHLGAIESSFSPAP